MSFGASESFFTTQSVHFYFSCAWRKGTKSAYPTSCLTDGVTNMNSERICTNNNGVRLMRQLMLPLKVLLGSKV